MGRPFEGLEYGGTAPPLLLLFGSPRNTARVPAPLPVELVEPLPRETPADPRSPPLLTCEPPPPPEDPEEPLLPRGTALMPPPLEPLLEEPAEEPPLDDPPPDDPPLDEPPDEPPELPPPCECCADAVPAVLNRNNGTTTAIAKLGQPVLMRFMMVLLLSLVTATRLPAGLIRIALVSADFAGNAPKFGAVCPRPRAQIVPFS
jgi:hypothetical protein